MLANSTGVGGGGVCVWGGVGHDWGCKKKSASTSRLSTADMAVGGGAATDAAHADKIQSSYCFGLFEGCSITVTTTVVVHILFSLMAIMLRLDAPLSSHL